MAQPARASAMTMTVDEFIAHPVPDGKAELIRGELRVTLPAGGPHGVAATNLTFLLGLHVRQRRLGRVFGDGFGYELPPLPRTVRVPDASFVRADRLPDAGIGPGLLKLAPDLAIEVLSPSETASELEEKLDDYLVSGTPLIWVVDPVRRTVMLVSAEAPVAGSAKATRSTAAASSPGSRAPYPTSSRESRATSGMGQTFGQRWCGRTQWTPGLLRPASRTNDANGSI